MGQQLVNSLEAVTMLSHLTLQLILQTVLVLLTSPHGDRPHLFQGTWNPRLLFLAAVALVMGSLSRGFRGWRMLLRSLESHAELVAAFSSGLFDLFAAVYGSLLAVLGPALGLPAAPGSVWGTN